MTAASTVSNHSAHSKPDTAVHLVTNAKHLESTVAIANVVISRRGNQGFTALCSELVLEYGSGWRERWRVGWKEGEMYLCLDDV